MSWASVGWLHFVVPEFHTSDSGVPHGLSLYRHPNACSEGIWIPKTYLKDFLRRYFGGLGTCNTWFTFLALQVVSLVGYPSSHHHGAAEKWVYLSVSPIVLVLGIPCQVLCSCPLNHDYGRRSVWLVGFSKVMFPRNHEDCNHISYSGRGMDFRSCLCLWACWCLTRWWFPTLIFTTIYLGKWSNLTSTLKPPAS